MNVFIIGTDHNLIQVKEAIRYYKIPPKDAFIIYMHHRNQSVTSSILPNGIQWRDFIIWRIGDFLSNREDYRKYIVFLKQLKRKSEDCVVYSNFYTSDFVLVANSILKPRKVILMDEGTALVRYVFKRRNKRKDLLKYVAKSLFYFRKISLPDRITFFSQYHLDVDEPDSIDFYEFEKEKNSLSIDNSYAIILGQPLSEANVVSRDDYIHILNNLSLLLNQNGYTRVEYYSHRREENATLERIKALGWTVCQNNIPFELLFPRLNPCPSVICGFYSPILDSLSKKYENIPDFYVIELPRDCYINNAFSFCNEIYSIYKKNPRLRIITV